MAQPMSTVVDKLRQGLAIRTRWPVSDISYDQGGAVLTGPDGVRLGARKVIVTASLAVLQSGRMRFSPELPVDKQGALKRLRMGNAAKVRGRRVVG
jgi:monoamine oxidase